MTESLRRFAPWGSRKTDLAWLQADVHSLLGESDATAIGTRVLLRAARSARSPVMPRQLSDRRVNWLDPVPAEADE